MAATGNTSTRFLATCFQVIMLVLLSFEPHLACLITQETAARDLLDDGVGTDD
jgi:hypothetical protein